MTMHHIQRTGFLVEEILDMELLEEMISSGYVKRTPHPDTDLVIYNYTSAAQYDNVWNPVTLACRGLIAHADGRLVARPFAKFFNYEQWQEGTLPSGPVRVTDKMDGSLGILYVDGNDKRIATRGSFTSEQAIRATEILQAKYPGFSPQTGWTYLFEIVYPDNRIVVDYADTEDLFLLAAIHNYTGRSINLDIAALTWPGPVVKSHDHASLDSALDDRERPNCEGFVVHFLDSDIRIKVKQADYLRLHRLVTDVSELRIWEQLSQGGDLSAWLDAVPDEFYAFVTSTADTLNSRFKQASAEAYRAYDEVVSALGESTTRKDFADKVSGRTQWPDRGALFSLLDGKDISEQVWRRIRPASHIPVWSRSNAAD